MNKHICLNCVTKDGKIPLGITPLSSKKCHICGIIKVGVPVAKIGIKNDKYK